MLFPNEHPRPRGSGMERCLYDRLGRAGVSGAAQKPENLVTGDVDVHQAEPRDGAPEVGVDPNCLERRNEFLKGVQAPGLLHPGDDDQE